MDGLSKKILSDPITRWVFSNSKNEIYIVGGYLRDIISKDTAKDVDFVIKSDFEQFARRTAKRFKGTFIILKKNQACRIVQKDRRVIDFTTLIGNIENDLARRDFTINAIAWSPDRGIIDPFGGVNDITSMVIKAVKPSNLADDPLRVLRAYRIATVKGFAIEKDTIRYLKTYASGLQHIASERITEELFRILNHNDAYIQLKQAYDNCVLDNIIIEGRKELRNNLRYMSQYSAFKNEIANMKIKRMLSEEIGQGLTRDGLIKLSILLINSNRKPSSQKNLSLSKAVVKGVEKLQGALKVELKRVADAGLYEAFKKADDHVHEAAILLSVKNIRSKERILKRADDFIKIRQKKLLTGIDMKNLINADSGAIIGEALEKLQRQRFLGKLQTKAKATAWTLFNFT
jgi:tRNA nucleotidyltransferase/poly(A) polymerase